MDVMLEFRVAVFAFLLSCVKDEIQNAVLPLQGLFSEENHQTEVSPWTDQIPPTKDSESFKVPPHIIECAVLPSKIGNGNLFASLVFSYNLMCDADYTHPLGSLTKWNCSTSSPINSTINKLSVNESDPDYQYGAYECIKKAWPATIYLEQRVSISNTSDCDLDNDGHLKQFEGDLFSAQAPINIEEFEFSLEFIPKNIECDSHFNTDNFFTEWTTSLTFRLVHKPKYKTIKNSVLKTASERLTENIKRILGTVLFRKRKVEPKFEPLTDKFYAGPCRSGSMIDRKYRSGFTETIPLCRSCQRGYYLNEEKGSCFRCAEYQYNDMHGALKCKICHNVHGKNLNENGDSMMDCYDWSDKRKWSAVSYGLLFNTLFHLFYSFVMIWSIRWTIRWKLSKTESTEDLGSTLV